jgi:hypothetical protein
MYHIWGERRDAYRGSVGKLEGTVQGSQRRNRGIILKYIFKIREHGMDWSGSE